MLSSLTHPVALSKDDFKSAAAELRYSLLQQQFQLSQKDRPVVIVIAGDDRSGRHESINTLLEWLDPRFIRVNAYGPQTNGPNNKPFFWRYWRDLPSAGNIGLYLREWTSTSVVQYLNDEITEEKLSARIQNIRQFEKTLCDDGALLIKIWLHLSKDAHNQRVSHVRDTAFFDPKDELALTNYDNAVNTIEKVLEQTHTAHAPWHVISGDDANARNIAVGRAVQTQLAHWMAQDRPSVPAAWPPNTGESSVLNAIDLTQKIKKVEYEDRLQEARENLRVAMTKAHEQGVAVVSVFEGVDAAGKGGAIRRIATALDAGLYRIVPIAKPTDDEFAHHYLWRFWKHIPADGLMTIFDRSWYGRVLVERVEGFAKPSEWQRAYEEINAFEQQLVDHGTVVVKFWLHIDQDEQLKRFQSREKTPHKQHKITDEDYRNREKWPDYELAIDDMIRQTDTQKAPWVLVPASDKKYARVNVIEALTEAIEQRL